MTNTALPDMRTHADDEGSDDAPRRRRGRYLPSAQVMAELAVLGPDLARVAADLRDRLTDQANSPVS